MTASPTTGLDLVWPADARTRSLAAELFDSVSDLPLISVHNGLPARYLAEDLPITDPVNLLVTHDQGVQALLRSNGIRPDFTVTDGRPLGHESRQAFALAWRNLLAMWAKPWMQLGDDDPEPVGLLPSFRDDPNPEAVYDALLIQLVEQPQYPRRVLAEADLGQFATSDDPADNLQAHEVLAQDPALSGRIVPTFSPDRYLDPAHRGWRTDADLLAEVTRIGTDDLAGFLDSLAERRRYFLARGALAAEHHSSDVPVARLTARDAAVLYRHARSGELLPEEARALQGHLLWESGRMAAEDGMVMGLYPPAGFATGSGAGSGLGDEGVADRVRPLLADFGASDRFRLRLFTIDADAYVSDILPLAAEHPALAAIPPTRFAADPNRLRAARVAAIAAEGVGRSLGVVDDMSGPFALTSRHRLARRLDAGALAELVIAGRLAAENAQAQLAGAINQINWRQPSG